MTSPTSVGSVSVEVLADAKALAKSLRKEVESAFKGLDLGKLIRDSLGNSKPIKVPVEPDFDTDQIPEKVRKTRVPRVPVVVDPLFDAFRAELRKQTAALAKQVHAKIPVDGDTSGLRAELGQELAALASQLRVKIPAEPGDRATLQAKLQAQVAEVSERLKAHVKAEVDVDTAALDAKLKEKLRDRKIEVKVDADTSAVSKLGGLFKTLGSFAPNLGGIAGGLSSLGGAFQSLASSAVQAGGSVVGALSAAAGPIGTILGLLGSVGAVAGAAFAAIAGGATFAIPAITALAGAIAAIPGALTGIGAAGGTLALGFKGISEAFKPVTGGGGGGAGNQAAQQARQIAGAARQVSAARRGIVAANRQLEAAERGVAAAQRGADAAGRNLAEAEDRVVAAQKRATLAQSAVNRARQDAVEDISDLNRALGGARLSEEDAALGVEEALRALNEVKLTGNIPDIKRADLAYRQALQTLDEATDTTGDLAEETAEANKKGVEGSDKVQAALQDQADAYDGVQQAQRGVIDAQNGVIDAADSLRSAQDGVLAAQDGIKSATDSLASAQDSLAAAQQKVAAGAGGAAKQVIKLAPAAQKFVNAIKALKPAFEDLRLDVQQKLFEGLDKTVTRIGGAWIPALKVTLGTYATTFNTFFKNLGTAITTPKFIADLQAGAEGFRQLIASLGDAITSKLLPAFGALAKASAPFLAELGRQLAGVVTQFSDWILAGERSGGLTDFFDRAVQALKDIFAIGRTVASIIGSIFEIITGSSPTAGGDNPLQTFQKGLQKVADYLADPANQQKIRDFIGSVQTAIDKIFLAAQKLQGMFTILRGIFSQNGQSLGADLGAAILTGLAASILIQGEALQQIGASLISGLGAGVVLTGHLLFDYFSSLFTELISGIKGLLGIQSPSTVFAAIGADLIRGLIQGVAGLAGSLVSVAVAVGRNTVVGLVNGIGSLLGTLQSRAAGLRTTVVNAVAGSGSWLVNAGRNAVIGLANGISSWFRNLAVTAGNARVYVQNALSNAGSWLLSHGRAVVIGLANGIINQIPGLGTVLSYVTAFIRAHKGPIEKDRVLLKPAGQAIMQGLISGIGDKRDALAAELADVTTLIAGTAVPALGTDMDAAITRSLSVADTRSLQAAWKPGATGDKVLDAFRDLIEFSFNGDPVAALGS